MLKKEIQIGNVYAVKVGETVRPVRVDYAREDRRTGRTHWTGTNLDTGRTVLIRSAAKFRYDVTNASS